MIDKCLMPQLLSLNLVQTATFINDENIQDTTDMNATFLPGKVWPATSVLLTSYINKFRQHFNGRHFESTQQLKLWATSCPVNKTRIFQNL